jgi:hypothetical protein
MWYNYVSDTRDMFPAIIGGPSLNVTHRNGTATSHMICHPRCLWLALMMAATHDDAVPAHMICMHSTTRIVELWPADDLVIKDPAEAVAGTLDGVFVEIFTPAKTSSRRPFNFRRRPRQSASRLFRPPPQDPIGSVTMSSLTALLRVRAGKTNPCVFCSFEASKTIAVSPLRIPGTVRFRSKSSDPRFKTRKRVSTLQS